MGILEEIKGRAKKVIGGATDNSTLEAEGSAQANKGAESRKADQARAAAKSHDVKAKLQEQKQNIADKA